MSADELLRALVREVAQSTVELLGEAPPRTKGEAVDVIEEATFGCEHEDPNSPLSRVREAMR